MGIFLQTTFRQQKDNLNYIYFTPCSLGAEMLAHNSLLTYSRSACINGTALRGRMKTGVLRRKSIHLRTCPSSTMLKVGFMPKETKVKLAKLVVDVLPGEVGLHCSSTSFQRRFKLYLMVC